MTGQTTIDPALAATVIKSSGAEAILGAEVVQSLWSGYGQIVRCHLRGGQRASVIVKHVRWPDAQAHPYGWSSERSHERKVRSYRVETTWYDRYADLCTNRCRVPECLAVETHANDVVVVLEDLDAAGYAARRTHVGQPEITACVSWLANFHATFLGCPPQGLWATGTYWHLATRPDELEAMADGPLKTAAHTIDRRLSESPFQTLVHGDAKLANFCFNNGGNLAAAVDFQYVGGGCGMKDLAYFVSSCLDEDDAERLAPGIVDQYFQLLAEAVDRIGHVVDFGALEQDWRPLYPVAWTDFSRFLQGWSPGHWKLHRYSEHMVHHVLGSL